MCINKYCLNLMKICFLSRINHSINQSINQKMLPQGRLHPGKIKKKREKKNLVQSKRLPKCDHQFRFVKNRY